MQLTYRGSVNRWECDENDHLNVRFCEHKSIKPYCLAYWPMAVSTVRSVPSLPAKIARQHIRFQAESRIAAPLGGYFAAVAGEEFQVLVELRNEVSGVVACSMLCTFADTGIVAKLRGLADRVNPEDIGHAWPRGIQRNLNLHSLTLDEALALGFRVIGAGVIEPDECSVQGLLVPHHCMGRISDSMPHLWGAVFPESQASEEEGGAVVEFRRSYNEIFMAGERLSNSFWHC